MSFSIPELIHAVEARGGHFSIDNECLFVLPEDAAQPLFEDLRQHEQEIIAAILERDAAAWQKPFQRWLYTLCIQSPRDAANLNSLLKNFQTYTAAQNRDPCYRDLFEYLLAEVGFKIRIISGIDLVFGLILAEDANMIKLCEGYLLP